VSAETCRCCPARLLPRKSRHGYCETCYSRWRRAGYPPDGPRQDPVDPARSAAAHLGLSIVAANARRRAAERREEFAFLVDQGLRVNEAAAAVGITVGTAKAYVREGRS
jgi:DNA-directed RNA polymerase specialized sigma24 family protein